MTKKITDYQQLPRNPNKGSKRGNDLLETSLEQAGLGRSIVVSNDGTILGGNHVQQKVVELFGTDVPVVEVETDGQTLVVVKRTDIPNAKDKRAQELILADNRVGDFHEYNYEILADYESDVISNYFFENELEGYELETVIEEDSPPDLSLAEQLQEKWQVQRGQVWQVGKHRVMCGDSTSADDVGILMGGVKAELCFTSPPYADMRQYGGNDLSLEKLALFIPASIPYCRYLAVNLGMKFKNHEVVPYWDYYIKVAQENGLKLLAWNIWNKMQSGSIGEQDHMFPTEHEFVFVFGESPKEPNRIIPKSEESAKREQYYKIDEHGRKVVGRRQADGSIKHSTHGQSFTHKPLGSVVSTYAELSDLRSHHPAIMTADLANAYLEAITQADDVIYEPFLGSGTTLVACEQTGRVGYGMEIHPPYCSVTLERLSKLGLEGQIIHG